MTKQRYDIFVEIVTQAGAKYGAFLTEESVELSHPDAIDWMSEAQDEMVTTAMSTKRLLVLYPRRGIQIMLLPIDVTRTSVITLTLQTNG